MTKGEAQQHFWRFLNAEKEEGEFVGVTTGLLLGGEPASYTGEIKVEATKRQQNPIQEITLWEQ